MEGVPGAESHHPPARTERDQKRRKLRNVRLLLILPFGVTAILLAPLAVLKKSSEVEVNLKVSRLSFVIGEEGDGLFTGLTTRSLSMVSFQKVDLAADVLEIAATVDSNSNDPRDWRPIGAQGETVITSRNHFSSVTFKDLTLNHLAIPPGSVTTLSWINGEPNFLKLRVDGREVAGGIAGGRTFLLSCNTCEVSGLPPRYDFDSKFLRFASQRGHVVTFRGRSEGITVAFDLPPGMRLVEQNIPIESYVDFTELDGGRRTSTVIGEGGKIAFKELKNREVNISAGDFVILSDLKRFFVKSLHLENGINIVLHGRVGTLKTGPPGFIKDRLPSLLERLYDSQRWTLYLNAVVLIGTTALAILKRLHVLREEG